MGRDAMSLSQVFGCTPPRPQTEPKAHTAESNSCCWVVQEACMKPKPHPNPSSPNTQHHSDCPAAEESPPPECSAAPPISGLPFQKRAHLTLLSIETAQSLYTAYFKKGRFMVKSYQSSAPECTAGATVKTCQNHIGRGKAEGWLEG